MKETHKLLLDLPTQIESERVILRRYEKGDGKYLFDLLERNDNRKLLKEHLDEASTIKTEEDAEILIRKRSTEWDARDRFIMGIWLKNENKYIGEIGIEPKKWDVPLFEIGFFLDVQYQGMGLANESVLRSMTFIFKELKAHKIHILTRDTNPRSYKLAERLGFHKEGHLRECSIENGKRHGLFYYGMLKDGFLPK